MTTRKNIIVLENKLRDIISEQKADGIRQEIESAYNAVKAVKKKLRGLGKMNKETKVLKAAARKMVDELEDLEDLDMEEEMTEEEEATVERNEQSEGYGSWKGLGMNEGITKLTESDMNTVIKNAYIKNSLMKDVGRTLSLIRRSIIIENIYSLKVNDFSNRLITEQESEWRGRNPGVSAAAGIDNIIDSMKKAWSAIKDSTTRKQIQNTLTKLNNFMRYSAELVGSGSSQRAPRSYDQLATPLPFPDLDEPEDLEDIDDDIEDFDEWMDNIYGGRF
tara:strand:+ start:610 stop:1440 length:831 start_codon:yes stop_codon:yes gene_type:complete